MVACKAMQLRFFKVETLLNNAFNIWRFLHIGKQCDDDSEKARLWNSAVRPHFVTGDRTFESSQQ